jgi:hypothetical protein
MSQPDSSSLRSGSSEGAARDWIVPIAPTSGPDSEVNTTHPLRGIGRIAEEFGRS